MNIRIFKKIKKVLSTIILIVVSLLLVSCNSINNIEPQDINDTTLEIIFIDVGQGDSILLTCGEHSMLVDGGPADASNVIYTILKRKGINHLDYIVNTHPDEDHVGGLSGALEYAKVDRVFAPCEKDTKVYQNFVSRVNKLGISIEAPNVGDNFELGNATVVVLVSNIGEGNNASIVLKVLFGETSFLLMGDAENEVEEYLLNNYVDVNCDLLKVSHHGSQYATSYRFLYEANPKYAVISVGENSYGHPTEEVLSRLRDADVKTYRTDIQGDITVVSDGKDISISTYKNNNVDTYEEIGDNSITKNENETDISVNNKYVLNKSSKKFHYYYCDNVEKINKENKIYSNDSREEIISKGYVPCKKCSP